MFYCASAMTETCLFFGNYVFRLGVQSVYNDLQRNFAAVADQALTF